MYVLAPRGGPGEVGAIPLTQMVTSYTDEAERSLATLAQSSTK
jgi:hypothetical protein